MWRGGEDPDADIPKKNLINFKIQTNRRYGGARIQKPNYEKIEKNLTERKRKKKKKKKK